MQRTLWILLVSSAVLLAASQLAQPPANLKQRVFVLGLSRTGTTSIGDALALLGYRRLGWKDIRSKHLVQAFIHGDLGTLVGQTRYFDAFEDLPWPYAYREMAEMYPDAKFILSLRKNETVWLESMRRHMGRGMWQPARYFYGAIGVDGNEETVLTHYRNHITDVRNYFQDKPSRYLELVIDGDDLNWKALCSLAECLKGIPTLDFPRSNVAAYWHNRGCIAYLHGIWGWTITRVEEHTSYLYYQRRWQIMNWTLDQAWHLVSTIELACCNIYFRFTLGSATSVSTTTTP